MYTEEYVDVKVIRCCECHNWTRNTFKHDGRLLEDYKGLCKKYRRTTEECDMCIDMDDFRSRYPDVLYGMVSDIDVWYEEGE
jgi:hypothetical protein